MGNDRQIIGDQRGLAEALQMLISDVDITRLIDRDDRTEQEVEEENRRGVSVLSLRNLEGYLYADEVLTALTESVSQPDKIAQILQAKENALSSTDGAQDDLKRVSGQIFTECRKILGLSQLGNNKAAFARHTLAPLIKPGMGIYDRLERDIFGA